MGFFDRTDWQEIIINAIKNTLPPQRDGDGSANGHGVVGAADVTRYE